MVAIPKFYLITAIVVVLFIIGSVVTMTYFEELEADIESVPECLPQLDPPHGNSVWDPVRCMYVMDISIDVGMGIPTDAELSKTQNQKVAQKLVNYTIKQYQLGGNDTAALDGLLIYKIGTDAFREVFVMKLQNQEYVAHYNPDKVGKTSLFLTVAYEPREHVMVQLQNNSTAWINYESTNRDGTSYKMMWLKHFDDLIFASGFTLPPPEVILDRWPSPTEQEDWMGNPIDETEQFIRDLNIENTRDIIEELSCEDLKKHIDGNVHRIHMPDDKQFAKDRLQSCENRGY